MSNLVQKPKTISGFPDLSRNPETILGFPKIWFGIGIEFEIPEKFGLGIGTWVSVWDPIPNHPYLNEHTLYACSPCFHYVLILHNTYVIIFYSL